MAVGLRHAQVNRQVCTAGKTYRVIKCDMATEVGFGQTVNAQLPTKAATVERDGLSASAASSTTPETMLVSMLSVPGVLRRAKGQCPPDCLS